MDRKDWGCDLPLKALMLPSTQRLSCTVGCSQGLSSQCNHQRDEYRGIKFQCFGLKSPNPIAIKERILSFTLYPKGWQALKQFSLCFPIQGKTISLFSASSSTLPQCCCFYAVKIIHSCTIMTLSGLEGFFLCLHKGFRRLGKYAILLLNITETLSVAINPQFLNLCLLRLSSKSSKLFPRALAFWSLSSTLGVTAYRSN